jgi:hypothetical protein
MQQRPLRNIVVTIKKVTSIFTINNSHHYNYSEQNSSYRRHISPKSLALGINRNRRVPISNSDFEIAYSNVYITYTCGCPNITQIALLVLLPPKNKLGVI